jgi:hypothetical protein
MVEERARLEGGITQLLLVPDMGNSASVLR